MCIIILGNFDVLQYVVKDVCIKEEGTTHMPIRNKDDIFAMNLRVCSIFRKRIIGHVVYNTI